MPIVAMTIHPDLRYPQQRFASPRHNYPEYPFDDLGDSDVYEAVRRVLVEYGCDPKNYGTEKWNPLGSWIKPGQRVFILPNFVMHCRPGESIEQFYSKCTHTSIIRAVMDYAIIASGSPELVQFGNAPLQGCNYDALSEQVGANKIASFYKHKGASDPGPHDLRAVVTNWTSFGALTGYREQNIDELVPVDLGPCSFLEDFYNNFHDPPMFRIGDYDPDRIASFHSPGRHVYVVNRRLLESDIIISIPKLKTHQKVGITCALKGTVGAIGYKECLAHHRKGGPEMGGDEYPNSTCIRDLASNLCDATSSSNLDLSNNVRRVAAKVLVRALRFGRRGIMGGAWHGNDTAWRMTLDIARILRFADIEGVMHKTPQRQHISMVDGIIAGEAEGPLTPMPRHIGAILFGSDIAAVDTACALLMGFDPHKIPLIHNSFLQVTHPVTDFPMSELQLLLNGEKVDSCAVTNAVRPFEPAKGWKGHIEAR